MQKFPPTGSFLSTFHTDSYQLKIVLLLLYHIPGDLVKTQIMIPSSSGVGPESLHV